MSNNSKILAGVIAAAGVAAAIALLLNTKGGREVLAEIKDAAGKAVRGWKNAATDNIQEAETAV